MHSLGHGDAHNCSLYRLRTVYRNQLYSCNIRMEWLWVWVPLNQVWSFEPPVTCGGISILPLVLSVICPRASVFAFWYFYINCPFVKMLFYLLCFVYGISCMNKNFSFKFILLHTVNTITCPTPDDVTCVSPAPDQESYAVGETVTYACPYGDGERIRTCQNDGTWTQMNLVCNGKQRSS